MTFIKRYRPWYGNIPAKELFIADVRTFDIPETIAAMIRNAPENCVAVTLRPIGGKMIAMAEREARRKNIRILWVTQRRQDI